eukprot:TRINITY_DN1861_c0_g1_i2.p1 TRINITY_DN1861_c0_g1~~TRINITY_DN1861_c0_g1_i2.p1  ORF type:complete len:114 (+),score=8.93 TRINITY_DN1861_c0_g1_i2:108-449(+)
MLSYELNCPFNDKSFFNFFIFSIAYCTQNIYLSLLLVHGGLNFFLALTSKLVEGFFPSLVNTDAHIHTHYPKSLITPQPAIDPCLFVEREMPNHFAVSGLTDQGDPWLFLSMC